MNWDEIQIWELLAGLGLFLFGMYMLEESIKLLAGRSFKIFLRKHTTNRFKAVAAGALITAILQSSSMVVLLVMSFAGAGIIGLANGIGIVLGANLGTTATGWLVSGLGFKFDIKEFIFPFLAIGGLGLIFLKSERLANFSKLLMGFSFMFLGLSYMKDGFAVFAEQVDLNLLQGSPGIVFFFIAFVLTALIQSSSAAMMIFLTALSSGIITFEQSLFMVIGADLGTTVTAIIGTIGAGTIRKRVGWAQFYFNIINAALAFAMMPVLIYVIQHFIGLKDLLFSMVAFHSLMNLSSIILILPFLGIFTKALEKYISSSEPELTSFIQKANPNESSSATEALEKESVEFIKKAIQTNRYFFDLEPLLKSGGPNTAYNLLQQYESRLVNFYNNLQQNRLQVDEVSRINNSILSIRYAAHAVKDVKDIRHNILDIKNSADEKFYKFYLKLRDDQKYFYEKNAEVLTTLNSTNQSVLRLILEAQGQIFDHETDQIYQMYDGNNEPEIAISSLLNLVREVNNSNRELVRAISNFVKGHTEADSITDLD